MAIRKAVGAFSPNDLWDAGAANAPKRHGWGGAEPSTGGRPSGAAAPAAWRSSSPSAALHSAYSIRSGDAAQSRLE